MLLSNQLVITTNWLVRRWERTMMSSDIRPKRERDAEVARQAILDAAEEIFAENGFDGARIDAIAAASGYNKSLIFHYFDDKLGLYTAVLKRIDQQGNELQAIMLAPSLENETILHDAREFRAFLEGMVGLSFDFLQSHPNILRILSWEAAEQWKTFLQIITRLDLGVGVTKRLRQ